MKKVYLLLSAVFCLTISINAQINIDSLGNAGIGTSTPSATLDVEGTFQLKDSTLGKNKVLTSDSFGNASWQTINAEVLVGPLPTPPYGYSRGGINIDPKTGSLIYQNLVWQKDTVTNSIFNIENNIKVGIGTPNPKNKLTVNTDAIGISQESDDGTVQLGTYTDNTFGAYFQTHSNHALNFATNNSNAQMTLHTNGNVGIGTGTPSAKLDIKLADAEYNFLGLTDGTNIVLTTRHTGLNNNSVQSRYEGMTANFTDIGQDTSGNFVVEQNNSKKLVLMPGGNVGIGTDTPSEKLEVNGSVEVNGNITANNMLFVESYYAYLNNTGDFTGSSSGTLTNLEYTSTVQNTDAAVFSMNNTTGALTILKPGVINVRAQFDVTRYTSGYTRMEVKINGTTRNRSLVTSNGDWQWVKGNLVWNVSAGDVLTLMAIPAQIDVMSGNPTSALSVKWTGVK